MRKDLPVQKPTPAATSCICSLFCLLSTVGTWNQKNSWNKIWTGSSMLPLIDLWLNILIVLCRVDVRTEIHRCAYSNPSLGLDGVIKVICHLMLLHFISCANFRHKQRDDHASITLRGFYLLVCFPLIMNSVVHRGFHLLHQKTKQISIALTIKNKWQVYELIHFFLDQRGRLVKFCMLGTSDPCALTLQQCHYVSYRL